MVFIVFVPAASQFTFSRFSVGTKKNRDEKLRRFVVVSPREVPSFALSWPFKTCNFQLFLNNWLSFFSSDCKNYKNAMM